MIAASQGMLVLSVPCLPSSLSLQQTGGKRRQRALGFQLCPIMTPANAGVLLRMEPDCPAGKFQGKLGRFLQPSVVSSITLTLAAEILLLTVGVSISGKLLVG